jgi:hypothetical protein
MRSRATLRCARVLRVVPDPFSAVRLSEFPYDDVHFRPNICLVVDADRHLLAPCTFCGRYFWSGGLRRHQHSCSHRNTTPSQPPACGASLPRGRRSPVPPKSLSLRSLPGAFCLSMVGPPKRLPRKWLGRRYSYSGDLFCAPSPISLLRGTYPLTRSLITVTTG